MAYIKIHFVKHVQNVMNYIAEERGPNDRIDAEGCSPEHAVEEFKQIAKLHHGKGTVQAVHIIQSWSEKESKLLAPEKFNQLGKTLVATVFPGHDFVIATHTETGKTHNHIVVNPWHSETGKKIENKKHHLYRLRDASDDLCLKQGLSIINQKAKAREANLPDKVQRMVKFNGRSYLLDMMQKADFARAYSTSFEEYGAILGEFDIDTKVQNKNITYFYPGKERGKRGSKLGRLYDKPGLIEAFGINEEKFRQHPEMRDFLRGKIDSIKLQPAKLPETGRELSFPAIATQDRLQKPKRSAPSPLQIAEINQAKQQSIIEYAQRNRIALGTNDEGRLFIKDRPYVFIDEHRWYNKRNRTEGNLIDFVAGHKNISLLQAVAEINQNTRLPVLEKQFGEQKRTFTSFYVPETERSKAPRATNQIAYFLRGVGIHENHAESLVHNRQLQVSDSGTIRLFAEDDFSSGLEFSQDSNRAWNSKKMGPIQSPFGTVHRLKDSLILFTDPFTLLKQGGLFEFSKRNPHASVLALFEPNPKLVDDFLADHPTVKQISFVTTDKGKRTNGEIDFFGFLHQKFPSISLGEYEPVKEVPGRGLEISFP